MATATTTVALNVTGNAGQQIKSIEKNIDGLGTAFSKLGGLIGGLAIGSFINNLAQSADKIVDLSNAIGVTAGQIAGLGAAFVQNGGEADGAQMAYIRLSKAVHEARDGSDELRETFKNLGVSQEQLRSQDLQGTMRATISALAAMGKTADTTGISMQLLGKANYSVDFQGLNSGLDGFISKATEAEKPMTDLAQIIDNIKAIGNSFGLEMMKSSEGLIGLFKDLTSNTQSIAESLVKLTNIVMIFAGAWLIFAKIIPGITAGMNLLQKALTSKTTVLGYLTGGLAAATAGMGRLFTGTGKITAAAGESAGAWTRVQQVFFTLSGVLATLARTFLRFLGLTGVIYGIAESIQFLGKTIFNFDIGAWINKITRIGDAFDWLKSKARQGLEWLGILSKKPTGVPQAPPGIKPPKNDRRMNDIPSPWKESPKDKAEREERDKSAVEQVKIANDLVQALSKVRISYMQLGEESKNNNNTLVSNLQFETSLIGKTEQQVELARALRTETESLLNLKNGLSKKAQEINAEIFDEIELQKRLGFLQLETKTSKEKDIEVSKNKVIVLNSELREIRTLTDVYQNMHMQNGAAIEKYITQQQTLKMLEKDRLQTLENITKAIEDSISRQTTLAGILQGINDKKVDMAFELRIQDFTPLEKQFAQIDENARKAALEASRSFAAGFAELDMTAERTKELANGLEQIAQSYRGIADAQIRSLENSRSWSAGWKKAFGEYKDNATNSARQAADAFNAVTSGLSTGIDKMVDHWIDGTEKTKYTFEDMAKSIIANLIKIELQAAAAKVFSSMGGSGGGGGGGGVLSSLWDWGKSLLGFAAGGSPPLNQASMVGEQGPELFIPRQKGTIIPNGTGLQSQQQNQPITNTYITNNIQAVDAKSVAQLFAENRKVLFGTVEMARKEMSYSR